MCLNNASVQLPRSLDGVLPQGEVTVIDVERGEPVALWSEPPRTLSGLADLFETHEVMVNDELVLELEGDEIRLTIQKRPRREVPQVKPSAWKSVQEPPPPRPQPAPEPVQVTPDERDPAMLGTVTSDTPRAPEQQADAVDAWAESDAWDDDMPRAPKVPPRTAAPEPRAWHEGDAEHGDDLLEESSNPFRGWLRALRSFFGGSRIEDEDPFRNPRDDVGENAVPPARQPEPPVVHAADPSPQSAWQATPNLTLGEEDDAPREPRAATHRRLREPDAGTPGGPSVPSDVPASRRRADTPPTDAHPAQQAGNAVTDESPKRVGPASVAPPSTPLFPGVGAGSAGGAEHAETTPPRQATVPEEDSAPHAPDVDVDAHAPTDAETPAATTVDTPDVPPAPTPTPTETQGSNAPLAAESASATPEPSTSEPVASEPVASEPPAAVTPSGRHDARGEDDTLGGDLRTRILRYLKHPEMPVVAKSERIAKRFDLDVATADELLADISADPPEGLRLTPVRDGAWRIERRLS